MKKKIWLILIIIIVIVFLIAYTSSVPFLFKVTYGINIPYPITYQSYLDEDGRDPSYFDKFVFREDLKLQNQNKIKYILDDSETWIDIFHIYLDGASDYYKHIILDEFPFETIQNGNYIYVQLNGNRMSILIYDTEEKTLYKLSQIIFLQDELIPYKDYVTIIR